MAQGERPPLYWLEIQPGAGIGVASEFFMTFLQSVKTFKNRTLLSAVTTLILLNLLSHFLPFERAALAPDDYLFLSKAQNMSFSDIFITVLLENTGRPLGYLFIYTWEKIMGLNTTIGLIGIFISTSLLTIIIYLLMIQLLGHQSLAFLGASFYLLLPNKLELYHTPIYIYINLTFTMYSLSLFCFILFIKKKKKHFFFSQF